MRTISFFFVISSLIQCILALDCKDVYYYHCPYDGKNIPPQAISSDQPDRAIIIPTPYLGGWSYPWSYTTGNDNPGRVLCTNKKDAFKWVPRDSSTNIFKPLLQINRQNWFSADGLPMWIGLGIQSTRNITEYLRMDCALSNKESAPIVKQIPNTSWQEFNLTIPENAIKGGVDSPQNPKPFYIGLVKFNKETYLAKIIQDTTWLEIVSMNFPQPIYITAARHIKILVSDFPASFYWAQLKTLDGAPITNFYYNNLVNGALLDVYRCRHGIEHFLTRNPNACKGDNIEALVFMHRFESTLL